MVTMGRHVGFSKLQTQYSFYSCQKHQSTLRSLKLFISIICSIRTSKNGGYFENGAVLKIAPG